MIGATLMEILRPWPIKIIFDGLLVPAENKDLITQSAIDWSGSDNWLLAYTSLSMLLIAIVGGFLGFFQSYLIASVGQKLVADIRLDLYRHVQRLSHSFHDKASTGDILARLTGDVVGQWLGAWTVFAAGISNIAVISNTPTIRPLNGPLARKARSRGAKMNPTNAASTARKAVIQSRAVRGRVMMLTVLSTRWSAEGSRDSSILDASESEGVTRLR